MEHPPEELPEIQNYGKQVEAPKRNAPEQLDPGPERILRQVIAAAEHDKPIEQQYELRHERRDEQVDPPPLLPPKPPSAPATQVKASLPPPPKAPEPAPTGSKVEEVKHIIKQLFADNSFKKPVIGGFIAGLIIAVLIAVNSLL